MFWSCIRFWVTTVTDWGISLMLLLPLPIDTAGEA